MVRTFNEYVEQQDRELVVEWLIVNGCDVDEDHVNKICKLQREGLPNDLLNEGISDMANWIVKNYGIPLAMAMMLAGSVGCNQQSCPVDAPQKVTQKVQSGELEDEFATSPDAGKFLKGGGATDADKFFQGSGSDLEDESWTSPEAGKYFQGSSGPESSGPTGGAVTGKEYEPLYQQTYRRYEKFGSSIAHRKARAAVVKQKLKDAKRTQGTFRHGKLQ